MTYQIEIIMIDETERKFLDTALKIFAKKGYTDATTLFIAEKAGFNEKTLFRKFKTKKNLYDQVLSMNAEKYKKELYKYVFLDKKFDSPSDFLENYIKNLARINWDNFEYIKLSHQESNELIESFIKESFELTSEYLEKNIQHQKIDYNVFSLTLNAFIYTINVERYQGRSYIKYEEVLDKFIKNTIQCTFIPK